MQNVFESCIEDTYLLVGLVNIGLVKLTVTILSELFWIAPSYHGRYL
jgi:hypothetical protein